ncbi:MAG: hypothetical protein HC795_01885 [Coleofasciculaceae cyanobacterium RL_1_1]|nr:hypothetical protein [Coleofasciculaceae cyanobacterium RL_1_1]
MPNLQSAEFLSPEDSARVDAALLTNQDKFLARLAIYALRSLRQVSAELQQPIEQINAQQISDWVSRDPAIQETIDPDASFTAFFTNLVIAARTKLDAAAAVSQTPLDALTIEQTIAWFESQGKPEA